MRVIIPFFGSRVAPNILYSDQALIVQLYSSKINSRKIIQTSGFAESEWLKIVDDYDIDSLICGGIDKQFMREMADRDVHIINNVAGEIEEVLSHLAQGKLKPGYGISYHIKHNKTYYADDAFLKVSSDIKTGDNDPESVGKTEEPVEINCLTCTDKVCLEGKNCQLCPLQAVAEEGDAISGEMHDVALDVASEPERVLCRVSELVYFCLGMQYKHIGVAFCTEMWKEAEKITEILKRFFHVTPVCCKIGGTNKAKRTESFGIKHSECNPVGVANTLNLAGTELNISIGFCMGSDIIFNTKSKAPVTTLFVKDKLLAHNPVGAVYSKYALEHLEEEF